MRGNRTLRYFTAHIRKLPQLSFKEKDILSSRLKKVTLEIIGSKYAVTEARIRQIERAAIRKIKNKLYQQKLFNA